MTSSRVVSDSVGAVVGGFETLPIIGETFQPLASVVNTVRLSSLGDRWQSLMRDRSIVRAELALADALLAPSERAACQEYFESHPLPIVKQDAIPWLVREDSETCLIGDKDQRDLLDLQWELDRAEASAYKRSKKGNRSRKPQPYMVPEGDDNRDDGLALDRLLFRACYPERVAQANHRVSGDVIRWRRYARERGLDRECFGEPTSDTAQDLLANLWQAVWTNAVVVGIVRDPNYIRMRHSTIDCSEVELTPIPDELAVRLTPLQRKLASLLPDCPPIEGNISELSRRTGIWRDALPAMLAGLQTAAQPWREEQKQLAALQALLAAFADELEPLDY